MSEKQRIQINVNLSPGQKEQLDIMALHYGSISAAVRVALDALWREYNRPVVDHSGGPILARVELASIEDDMIHEDGDAGRPSL